jgi:hypothetical protein
MFKEFSPDLDICFYCTVIRFVTVSAKFGTVVGVNIRTHVESKMCTKTAHSPLNPRILSSTSVPFTLKTVQVPNFALRVIETNRIIACAPLKNN